MSGLLAVLTYFSYIFIVVMYGIKIVKYLALPVHLRWELYPFPWEDGHGFSRSRFENVEWWTVGGEVGYGRGILYLLKEYLHLGEYFRKRLSYWVVLYPWHVGFMLIILFHILCFASGVAMALGITVEGGSQEFTGKALYYTVLASGVISFVLGGLGSVGLAVKRLSDRNLRLYASPLNYFGYLLTFVVFGSGFYAWCFVDPAFTEYREFWKGLVTFRFIAVEPASMVHIVLFDLFLIYLPFTRSMHYITRFFAYFMIRWDERPNTRGSELEKELVRLQGQTVSWRGPHIKPGSPWSDQVKGG